MSWNNIAELLELITQLKRSEWKVDPPAFDVLPDEVLDFAVSAWCFEFVKNIEGAHDIPQEVQPWMLARFICAQVLCLQLAGQNEPSPSEGIADILEILLISEWHGSLRDKWAAMVLFDLPDV